MRSNGALGHALGDVPADQGGAELADGAQFGNVIEGFDCVVRPTHQSHVVERLGFALLYYRYRGHDPQALPAYQLFWPGKQQGLYTLDRDCVSEVCERQPLLYLPRARGLA